ncbi:Bifunctional glutamate/proline--tRNA ligase [Gryllus bimaculatus]|nr:Bifunctional glutamate/proline--tRNA ligase [Gryllus bimaculatus]
MAINLLASRSDPPLAALVVANMVRSSVCVSVKWGTRNALELPGATIDSPLNICRYLARTLQNDSFYGSDALQRTEIDHWLMFSIGPLSSNGEFSSAVEYLNQVLGPATYLVGNHLTLADIYVWSTLHKSSNWINLLRSSKALVNATRWYNFISSLDIVTALMSSLPDVVSSAISVSSVTEKGNKDTAKPKDEGKFVELPGAEKGKVVVRFPPEASGYLHIGHAKAALLNQYYKDAYEGKLIMRFDDTNPAKEKIDFEKVILEDLKLLKLTPDSYTHTSNYFELMLELCEKLLHQGLAYVDDTDAETMKQEREQRIESKNRNNCEYASCGEEFENVG